MYLLEGGSLALYRSLGTHLQLLAQCHQLLHFCHHHRLFLINQLEQRGKERDVFQNCRYKSVLFCFLTRRRR